MSELTPKGAMEQAPSTVEYYMEEATRFFIHVFGDTYAKKSPEVFAQFLGQYAIACANDFHAWQLGVVAKRIEDYAR